MFWVFFPGEKKSFYIVLKEAKPRAVCVALGFCAGRLSSFHCQWGDRESSLWVVVQSTEGLGAVMCVMCPERFYLALLTF